MNETMKGYGESQKSKKELNIKPKTYANAEQLIEAALKCHSQGNIAEAAKYYQLFIGRVFIDPGVLSNYGAIHRQNGQPEVQSNYTRKQLH